jgi:hypothetical protein
MGELEIERQRAGTKRDMIHLEVRIAVQESCFPHPEGNSDARNWQREVCILYTVAHLVNVGILLLWITFSGLHPASPLGGHRIRGSTQTGVVAGFGSTLSGIRLHP